MTAPTYDEWWRSAVVYQIYPRSFADADGDGVGDLRGILEHVDHLVDLGVDVIWLSPVYRSPQDDNGYDISDYDDVDPVFGTLADLDEVIAALHERGIRLVMDLVVNHTSDEHAWFTESRSSRDNPLADWYVWRDPRPGHVGGEPGAEPTNWASFFSGPAWEWDEVREQYYLHLFSRKQPDLDWENPQVRAAVYAMMGRWLDRGVDGFRMDVINMISKDQTFLDGAPLPGAVAQSSGQAAGQSGLGDGTPSYICGPRLLEFLTEMRREVFDSRPGTYLTVGEMPLTTTEQALTYTDVETGPLDMVFQFEHVDLDGDGSKWVPRESTLVELKHSLARWQVELGERGWNSLYWCNHDQPRPVSRFGDDSTWWRESATLLATVLHLHRGTPYVYQGEELGMRNVAFADVSGYRDIESLNFHAEALAGGADADELLSLLHDRSRDNARTPVQWTAGKHAGFTTGTPWIAVNPDHTWLNAAAQRDDEQSIRAHYRALIALRHDDSLVVSGDFVLLEPDHPVLWSIARTGDTGRLAVYANCSGEPLEFTLDPADLDAELVLGNVMGKVSDNGGGAGPVLGPWEVRVLRSGG